MKSLLLKIDEVKNSETKKIIDSRVKEFEKIRLEKNKDKIFLELCFCLMTANWQAAKAIELQKKLEKDFFDSSEEQLAQKLKIGGHRFWPQRAFNIVEARKHKEKLHDLILNEKDEKLIREWIAENVRGLGMKESSHFLRNVGYKNLAIIDFHIIDLLVSENLIEKPKTITKKRYIEIEKTLEKVANASNLSQGELDLYLWYIETGKVLK